MKKINWWLLLIAFATVHLIAFVGSRFTDTSGWYDNIKPAITPPNYIFPIAWTILFILISLSFYFVLMSKEKKVVSNEQSLDAKAIVSGKQNLKGRNKKIAIYSFIINLILNGLWSYLFFGLHNPILAFVDLILLWITILGMIYFSYKLNKTASYLLIPYLLWISFAGVLNYLIAF